MTIAVCLFDADGVVSKQKKQKDKTVDYFLYCNSLDQEQVDDLLRSMHTQMFESVSRATRLVVDPTSKKATAMSLLGSLFLRETFERQLSQYYKFTVFNRIDISKPIPSKMELNTIYAKTVYNEEYWSEEIDTTYFYGDSVALALVIESLATHIDSEIPVGVLMNIIRQRLGIDLVQL